jgi:hypothetical protein
MRGHPEAVLVPWTKIARAKRAVLSSAPVEDDPRCAACGGVCCRSFASVPLTWPEYERLDALGAQRIELGFFGPHRLVIDGGCEFLADGRCSIYRDRPGASRRFMCAAPASGARPPREDAVREKPPER